MEEEVHGAEAGGAIDDFDSVEGVELEEALFVGIHFAGEVMADEFVGGEEEASGSGGGVHDGLAGFGLHDVNEGADERARGEVLAGAGFNVFCVLLEESFVDVTFDVGVENGPGFFVDEVGDEAFEFGGVLDFVLGLAEDGPEHAGFLYVVRARTGRATRPVRFAEVFEGAAVMDFEGDAVEFDEGGPGVIGGITGGWFQGGRVRSWAILRNFCACEVAGNQDEDPGVGGSQGRDFQGAVTESFVFGEDHPASFANHLKPDGVFFVAGEVIVVDLYGQPASIRTDLRGSTPRDRSIKKTSFSGGADRFFDGTNLQAEVVGEVDYGVSGFVALVYRLDWDSGTGDSWAAERYSGVQDYDSRVGGWRRLGLRIAGEGEESDWEAF